jgi:hypothetical protein
MLLDMTKDLNRGLRGVYQLWESNSKVGEINLFGLQLHQVCR